LIAACLLRNQPIAFDTQAVIGYVEDREPITALLAPLFERHDVPVVISAVTLAEVLVLPVRNDDLSLVATLRRSIAELPAIRVVAFDDEIAVETAIVRGRIGLPLPDAAIVATARFVSAVGLVGNDRRWRAKSLGVPYYHLDDVLAL
jgi:PIN domain nuclease of toxin-antitoxin system